MPLKLCKICNYELGKDRKTGKFWCSKCHEIREDYKEAYKICLLGKNTGKEKGYNNFLKSLGRALERLGHIVVEINMDQLYNYVPEYYMNECFARKKKIPLKFIDYYNSPDILMVEQTYNRYDVSDLNCDVIYQHREYTHFPDIEDPDILFGSYPHRTDVFEQFNPYAFDQIPYVDNNFVAVDTEIFKPKEEKSLKGLTYLGWASPPMNFYLANGIIAKAVIYDQMEFMDKCKSQEWIRYLDMGKGHEYYVSILKECEAIIVDAGFINGIGRTVFEAMASKTAVCLKVHHPEQMNEYKELGLHDGVNCIVFSTIDELEWKWEKYKKVLPHMIERAYDYVLENHTYDIRAKEMLQKYEEYKSGVKKKNYLMGYAMKYQYEITAGQVIVKEE